VSWSFRPVDIERFHAGDERLFSELVRTYSPRLLPQLRRYAQTGSHEATDLLQEVWLRAFQKRRGFDGRGSLFGWLLTICRTVGMAAITRPAAFTPLNAADHVAVAEQLEPAIERRIEYQRVRLAVDELPPRQREVLLLRITEERSTAETAQILGVAEGTVKASLHAAIHKLQEMLREKVP
jgi:RNA polymerase sigma-70 factor (ECF subfamily)